MNARLALTAIALTLGLAQTASAGTYIGLGIGSEAPVDGTLGDLFSTDGASHGRLVVGKRFGALALEGSIFGTEMSNAAGTRDGFTTAAVAVDLKYHVALAGGLEAYVKGGLHRAFLSSEAEDALDSFEGNGHQYGGGLQYNFDLALSSAALWVDYNRTQFELSDGNLGTGAGRELAGTAKLLTVGLSIGF